ncbi:sulfate ABC transporter substrate-binding protein [Nocardioides panacis]|uniref:Sulfate ABC transporter substrate-binding protein n=1 Tax=Nocardioides panacis TaxID=2849501 RepID=A0A975SX93_9ACTN|nr:sulfate ABC transporter substrate-binding protein [Nocardioides panacis]QWZ07125.1 sulfate ABC transporter substrate-binding protein [Nocardioides panacis]
MSIKWKAAIAGAVVGALALSACGGSSSGSSSAGSDEINLVGFSILEQANKQVIADWNKTADGKDVAFKQSYGASGDQARGVIGGQKADVVHLSLEPDVQKLVDAKLVADDWKSTPTKGILTQSVVVMVVRTGNPKNIETWDDLTKPGVKIITPNPASSGSAKWNILAAYGHVLADGGSEADAAAYLTKFFGNVAALPGSGRDATTAFQGGNGDVLLSYENEAILARQSGADFDYVVPPETLLIQNPGAVTTDATPKAEKFLEYLTGTEAQTDYAEEGFRPLDDSIKVEVKGANDPSDPFPAPSKKLLTIDDDFGGWSEANTKFFDENDGIVTKIQKETGKES